MLAKYGKGKIYYLIKRNCANIQFDCIVQIRSRTMTRKSINS